MLTSLIRRAFQQPAAAVRRRLLVYVAGACGLGALVLLGSLRGVPAEPPLAATVRRSAHAASRLIGERSPGQADYLGTLLGQAERITAQERALPWWRRTPGRMEAAWLRTAVAARDAARAHRAHQDQIRLRYEALLESASQELDRARREIRETGMSRPEAAAFRNAELSFATALQLAGIGRDEEAILELERVRVQSRVVSDAWLALHSRFRNPALRRQWQAWAQETIRHSKDTGEPVILVDKLRRRLFLYRQGQLKFSFPAELGANGLRTKSHYGDRATPEGVYHVVDLKQGRRTSYYKALLINYPNREDQVRFAARQRRGEIPRRVGIGSLIEIHGSGGEGRDWTDGCVALRNDHMDVVFAYARLGTPVTIVGTYD